MPHILLAKLRKFVEQPDIKELPNSDNEFLKEILEIGDASCVLLDDVQEAIGNLWRGKKPPIEFAEILDKNGFPVVPGDIQNGIWQSAFIKTKKGKIRI